MSRPFTILFFWCIVVWLLALTLAPSLNRIAYPQPVDLIVLLAIPIGAFHAARFGTPRMFYSLYGYVTASIFLILLSGNRNWLHGNQPLWSVGLQWSSLTLVVMITAGELCKLAADYRLKSPYPPHCCRTCGYDLTGNVSGICPECGNVIRAIR